jgi:hypothetical protein
MDITIIYKCNNLQCIVDLIKILRSIGASIDYSEADDYENIERRNIVEQLYSKILIDDNMENVQYVLNDMGKKIEGIIEYMLSNLQNCRADVANLIVEQAYKKKKEENLNNPYKLFMKTRNDKLLKWILRWLGTLDLFKITKNLEFMDILTKNMDRETFKHKIVVAKGGISSEKLAFLLSKYDEAVKRRVTEVSLGLGYAQFNNQEQSIIPSLILQQIVNESVDVSGIPAQDVYQIVKHINEGMTNNTIRLGPEYNFADVKEEAIKIGRLGLDDNYEDAYDQEN